MIELLRKYGFVPRVAVWELSLRCNLSCLHCGSRAGKARPDELSLAECLKLADELALLGCRIVTLGGGEPSLRRDWPLIAERLIERGVRVGMISNGLEWTEQHAHTAKVVGLDSVAFSLDGFRESHDHLRHSKGLFDKVLRAFDVSRAHGVRVSAVTTVYQRNLSELEGLRELLAQHGVDRWQIQIGTATGNLSDHPELLIPPEAMLELVPRIAKMCRDGKTPRVFPSHDIGYFGEPEESLRDPKDPIPFWTGCSAGCSIIGIESNGNIKGCLSLPSAANGEDRFVEGNVREQSLRDIWSRPGAFAYNREFSVEQLGGFCRTCDYAEVCRGGCTWTSFAQGKLSKDNAYCYWRQLHERGGDGRLHLDVV